MSAPPFNSCSMSDFNLNLRCGERPIKKSMAYLSHMHSSTPVTVKCRLHSTPKLHTRLIDCLDSFSIIGSNATCLTIHWSKTPYGRCAEWLSLLHLMMTICQSHFQFCWKKGCQGRSSSYNRDKCFRKVLWRRRWVRKEGDGSLRFLAYHLALVWTRVHWFHIWLGSCLLMSVGCMQMREMIYFQRSCLQCHCNVSYP